jgi:hypothetical protein
LHAGILASAAARAIDYRGAPGAMLSCQIVRIGHPDERAVRVSTIASLRLSACLARLGDRDRGAGLQPLCCSAEAAHVPTSHWEVVLARGRHISAGSRHTRLRTIALHRAQACNEHRSEQVPTSVSTALF